MNKPAVLYVMANKDNMEQSEVNMSKIANAKSMKELAAAIRQLAATLTPPVMRAPLSVPLQSMNLALYSSSRPEDWFSVAEAQFALRSVSDELSDTLCSEPVF